MNNLIKKGVVVAIVLLFVSVSVIPSTGINVLEQSSTVSFDDNILYVGGNGTGNYTKIQDAIDDAFDGDTVFVYDDSSPYYENVVVDKSINLIGEDRDTTIIDGGEKDDVIFISADNVTISGFTIQNCSLSSPVTDAGIEIDSNYNTISGNTISNNLGEGLRLHYSNNNIISDNNILNNLVAGIRAWYSNNNIFTQNIILNNSVGIRFVTKCIKNNILGNVINLNGVGIVTLYSSNRNIISNNTVSSNSQGIYIYNSTCNTISKNNISNSWRGIWLQKWYSSINLIYHNNFFNNNQSAYDKGINQWNKGNEGNYWDDWIGFRFNFLQFLPYHIPGTLIRNFDWRPAREPYDLGV